MAIIPLVSWYWPENLWYCRAWREPPSVTRSAEIRGRSASSLVQQLQSGLGGPSRAETWVEALLLNSSALFATTHLEIQPKNGFVYFESSPTLGVNVINILCSIFLYKSASRSFSLVTYWLHNFCCKNICAKGVCKMLMKLIQGIDFISNLDSSFLYKSALQSFSLVTFWLCNFLAQKLILVQKHK